MVSLIRAVLFDYGMVLSGPPRPSAWKAMQTALHLDESRFSELYWKYRDDYDRGTLNADTYWGAIASDAGISLTPAHYDHLYEQDTELWTDLNTPMVEWLFALRKAGIRTGLLSNIGDKMVSGITGKFDWMSGFHHSVYSHALKMRKPEPEIYAAAIAGLGVAPEEILFIDDREENTRAASAAGIQSIVYTTHAAFLSEMERRGLAGLLHPETYLDPSAT